MNDYVEIVCFFIDVFYMKEWLSWTIRQAEINLSLNTRYKQTQRAKIYLANRKDIFKPFFFYFNSSEIKNPSYTMEPGDNTNIR